MHHHSGHRWPHTYLLLTANILIVDCKPTLSVLCHDVFFPRPQVTYEDAVAKMAAAEVGEDAEVSTILQDHPPLIPTRSDASFHSLQYSQYTGEGEWY